VEVGQRFGHLVVTSADARIGVKPTKPKGWRAAACRCDCGAETVVTVSGLINGKNRSCGNACDYSPGKMSARTLEGRVRASNLTRSLTPEQEARRRTKRTGHGFSPREGRHPLYRTWNSVLGRCENPRAFGYHSYGGRGIKVCERWHDIAAFIEDIEREIGPRPAGRHPSGRWIYTLDRRDVNGHYEPGNVRWATAAEQQANRRQSHKLLSAPQ